MSFEKGFEGPVKFRVWGSGIGLLGNKVFAAVYTNQSVVTHSLGYICSSGLTFVTLRRLSGLQVSGAEKVPKPMPMLSIKDSHLPPNPLNPKSSKPLNGACLESAMKPCRTHRRTSRTVQASRCAAF